MPTGKNRVPMAPLRAALEKAGLANVRTYIQSGNVIAASRTTQAGVETLVHDVIQSEFGGDLAVLARTPAELRGRLARNPFQGEETTRLYFTLLAKKPEAGLLKALLARDHAPDKIAVIGDMVYLLCATRYSDAKQLNNNVIERRLKLDATTRNHNTMTRLIELAAEHGAAG